MFANLLLTDSFRVTYIPEIITNGPPGSFAKYFTCPSHWFHPFTNLVDVSLKEKRISLKLDILRTENQRLAQAERDCQRLLVQPRLEAVPEQVVLGPVSESIEHLKDGDLSAPPGFCSAV